MAGGGALTSGRSLWLPQREQRALAEALELLLSPFGRSTHRQWRRDVCRAMKAMFGADLATIILDVPGQEAFFSEDLDLAVLHAYPASIRELDVRWNAAERHARAGAYDRRILWGRHLQEYYRTAYYNEFIRPIRGFHAIGLADAMDHRPVIGRMPNLVLHRCTESRPFSDRALSVMRILMPAFRASARMLHAVAGQGTRLLRLLDGIGHAVYTLDHCGKRHRNRALDDLLVAEPERLRLVEECERTAQAALHLRMSRLPLEQLADATIGSERTVRTSRGSYRLLGSLIPHPVSGADPCAIVVVQPVQARERLSADELRHRFGLTRREMEVAYLLADRRRQNEVARLLKISVHTARRHTERVMQKLGVQRREDVAARISVEECRLCG